MTQPDRLDGALRDLFARRAAAVRADLDGPTLRARAAAIHRVSFGTVAKPLLAAAAVLAVALMITLAVVGSPRSTHAPAGGPSTPTRPSGTQPTRNGDKTTRSPSTSSPPTSSRAARPTTSPPSTSTSLPSTSTSLPRLSTGVVLPTH